MLGGEGAPRGLIGVGQRSIQNLHGAYPLQASPPNAACPVSNMNLPFDILDHIFGFLITHPGSLVACSEAHPVFSRMVEKYQYYCLTIDLESTRGHLTKLLSDKPQIRNYVCVLRIEFDVEYRHISITRTHFERIAAILPLFSALECIVLSIARTMTWCKGRVSYLFYPPVCIWSASVM